MKNMVSALWRTVAGGTAAASSEESDSTVVSATPSAAPDAQPERYVAGKGPLLAVGRTRLDLVATLSGHEDRVWSVAWHPSGDVLASCSGDKTVRLWSRARRGDDTEWRCIGTLDGEHGRTVRSVAWSPDGRRLAAASFDATVSIWRRVGPQFEMTLESLLDGHETEVKAVSWDRTGRAIASCARDKTVQVWEDDQPLSPAAHGKPDADDDADVDDEDEDRGYECTSVLQGHSQDVKCVAFHPDSNKVMLSASYDETVKMWEELPFRKDDWHCTQTLTAHTGTVWGLAFQAVTSPTDRSSLSAKPAAAPPRLLATCSDDGSTRVWALVEDSADRPAGVKAVRWSLVATSAGVHEGSVYSVDWAAGELLASNTFSPAPAVVGPVFATGGADDTVAIYELRPASEAEQLDGGDTPAVASKALVPTPVVVQRDAHQADVNCVRFCPAPAQPPSHDDDEASVAPQGAVGSAAGGTTLLASASDDGTVKIWRLTA